MGRQRVGVVTSGTRSPTLRKNVALCRMAVQYSELGTEVEVGKLDGTRSASPRRSCASPSTTPTRRARAREPMGTRPPAEFDFPTRWTGPDGIGDSPFDEFAEDEAPDVGRQEGSDPAVALSRRSACSPPASP